MERQLWPVVAMQLEEQGSKVRFEYRINKKRTLSDCFFGDFAY